MNATLKTRSGTSKSIYESKCAPKEFITAFTWWAYRKCPNQQYTMLSCGARSPNFTEKNLTKQCMKRIKIECNKFWNLAKPIIKSSKGRCNWSPSVDTDINHISNCAAIFFFARQQKHFFMDSWPDKERIEIYKLAKAFGGMFLKEENGSLEFCEGNLPDQSQKS